MLCHSLIVPCLLSCLAFPGAARAAAYHSSPPAQGEPCRDAVPGAWRSGGGSVALAAAALAAATCDAMPMMTRVRVFVPLWVRKTGPAGPPAAGSPRVISPAAGHVHMAAPTQKNASLR